MVYVPLGDYLPDQPDYAAAGSASVRNVVPRTAGSYGPMAGLVPWSGPLAARAQGAIGLLDGAGTVSAFAGDASRLYRLAPGSTSWTDVSKPGGYNAPSDGGWRFAVYGARVIATNFNDPIQSCLFAGPTAFGDLASAAPHARHITVVRNFVVAAGTWDPVSGSQPQRVWWSAINDPTNWPAPGGNAALAVQSDYQDIPGDQGWCQGIVGNLGTADAAIFFERAVFRMIYLGGSPFFAFQPAEGVRGTPAPGSIAQLGALVFYLGEDGFYSFDGSNSTPIGAGKVDKTFLADLDQSYFHRISSTVDPQNKLVLWAYPGTGSAGGMPNRIIAYNWELGRWSLIDGIQCQILCRTLGFGYTLERLDALGGSLDALPFSLDSRAWTDGRVLLSGFDTGNRLGYFDGPNLAARVETGEVQFFPGRRALVTAVRPIVDGGTPSVAVAGRDLTIAAPAYGAPVAVNGLGEAPQRSTARYHRAQIAIPAGQRWQHIQGVEFTARPEGVR